MFGLFILVGIGGGTLNGRASRVLCISWWGGGGEGFFELSIFIYTDLRTSYIHSEDWVRCIGDGERIGGRGGYTPFFRVYFFGGFGIGCRVMNLNLDWDLDLETWT